MPLDLVCSTSLRIGDWIVDSATGDLSRGEHIVRLEDRELRLLLCLAEQAGSILSIDELLKQVWPGIVVTPDAIHQAITALRRQLGDDPKHPLYIATVPGRGYRLVATVGSAARAPLAVARRAKQLQPQPEAGRQSGPLLLAIALVVLVGGLVALGMLAWHESAQVDTIVIDDKKPAVKK